VSNFVRHGRQLWTFFVTSLYDDDDDDDDDDEEEEEEKEEKEKEV
jgi:hypothetical protein